MPLFDIAGCTLEFSGFENDFFNHRFEGYRAKNNETPEIKVEMLEEIFLPQGKHGTVFLFLLTFHTPLVRVCGLTMRFYVQNQHFLIYRISVEWTLRFADLICLARFSGILYLKIMVLCFIRPV